MSNNLSENENLGSFSVVLDIKPNSDVFMNITSNDSGEVAVDSSFQQLQFTPLNWNIPQTVLVTGVDDTIIDGDQFTQMVISVDGSSDTNFTSEAAQNVNVINEDNDIAQITITPIDQLTGENGDSGSFSVRLTAMPSTSVQIGWASSNMKEGTVATSTITFTPANWDQEQIINVNGKDDLIPISDGAVNYNIFINSILTTDPHFSSIIPGSISPVSMINQDNDFAGITVYLLDDDYQTDEDGDQASIGFSLNTLPMNDEAVTIPITLRNNVDEIDLLETQITIENQYWNDPRLQLIYHSNYLIDFVTRADTRVEYMAPLTFGQCLVSQH